MDWAVLGPVLLGLAGLGGSVVAILKFKPDKKKLEAEAEATLSRVGLEWSQRADQRAERADERASRLEKRLDAVEEEQDEHRQILHVHADWDRETVRTVKDQTGIDLPPPPPLFLPRKVSPSDGGSH